MSRTSGFVGEHVLPPLAHLPLDTDHTRRRCADPRPAGALAAAPDAHRAGVPLQRIRPALTRLDEELGIEHALASRRLRTDGAEVLYDDAERGDDENAARAARELVVVRSDQRVVDEVVDSSLRRLEFADDGSAHLIRLPAYEVADVLVDPSRGLGRPIFARGGARLEDALALFRAGEPLDVVADEYGVPPAEPEDAVRIATRITA